MTELLQLENGKVPLYRTGDGPLVILRHALGPPVWGWPLNRLAATCTVVALGRYEPTADGPRAQPSSIFCQVAHALGHDSFNLCAWSMAGAEALTCAVSNPPELERLILVDIAGLGGPLSEQGEGAFLQPATPHISRDQIRSWAHGTWRGWVHRGDFDTTEYEELTFQWLVSAKGRFQHNLKVNRQAISKPLLEVLGRVEVPTLVLAGRHSLVLGPEAGAQAVERLPDGRMLVFEGSAHAIPLEEPGRFQDEVAAFVCARKVQS